MHADRDVMAWKEKLLSFCSANKMVSLIKTSPHPKFLFLFFSKRYFTSSFVFVFSTEQLACLVLYHLYGYYMSK